MNITNEIIGLLLLAGNFLKSYLAGGAAKTDQTVLDLLGIVQASVGAFEAHTGKPIDPLLLHPEQPL